MVKDVLIFFLKFFSLNFIIRKFSILKSKFLEGSKGMCIILAFTSYFISFSKITTYFSKSSKLWQRLAITRSAPPLPNLGIINRRVFFIHYSFFPFNFACAVFHLIKAIFNFTENIKKIGCLVLEKFK